MAYDKMSDAQKRQSGMKIPESPTKPMMEKKKKKTVKTVKKPITKKTKTVLTKAMELKLKKHLNHSAGHMKMMRKLIERGETFKDAHTKTVSQVGN